MITLVFIIAAFLFGLMLGGLVVGMDRDSSHSEQIDHKEN